MRNLCDLNHSMSPYSLPVIQCPFSVEIVEGEHFVVVDLQYLVPGSSSLVRNFEIETTGQEPVISIQPEQPSLVREDSILAPQVLKSGSKGGRFEIHPLAKKGSCLPP